jgi:DNA repair protein RadC
MPEIQVYQCKMERVKMLEVQRVVVYTDEEAAEVIIPLLKDLDREHLIVLYLTGDRQDLDGICLPPFCG